jgi:hypothetical protein
MKRSGMFRAFMKKSSTMTQVDEMGMDLYKRNSS